jgi:hypothetical protein
MALGFGTISTEPLCTLPHLAANFLETCVFAPLAEDPVASLTGDPLKRLVFAVEIAVLPLTGATVPVFGTEVA